MKVVTGLYGSFFNGFGGYLPGFFFFFFSSLIWIFCSGGILVGSG